MAVVRSLTQNQMVDEVAARLSNDNWPDEFSDDAGNAYKLGDIVKEVLAQLHETVLDEIEEGIPVNLLNIARLTTRYTPSRPAGWRVNRFSPDEEVWSEARPAKIVVKARATSAVQAAAPTTRSSVGQRIAKDATSKAKRRDKAARDRERQAA